MPGLDLSQFPHLHAYVTRIGAQPAGGFRSFKIKVDAPGGYWSDRLYFKVKKDGTIIATTGHFDATTEPTTQEREDIKEEWTRNRARLPKWTYASVAQLDILQTQLGSDTQLYAFYSRANGMIIMAQQRIQTPEGKKYLPWSFYDNGEWICREPETDDDEPFLLPFWKPQHSRGKNRFMIHEGAKSAQFVDELINNPENHEWLQSHPWAPYLMMFE